jgi:hypothetical protein
MANRIVDVQLEIRRLHPLEAEIGVAVTVDHVKATTQIRGRMVGPKSERTSTIEVAYPLTPLRHEPGRGPALAARVVIPEPSLSTPELPYTYDAIVELWEDGELCDQHRISGFHLQTGK